MTAAPPPLLQDGDTRIVAVAAIEAVERAQWNALDGTAQPFLRHELLAAMERRECVGDGTGWQPHHLVALGPGGELRGAMPLYLKHHSWGEFVFDFAWAQAYARTGRDYYPKLVSMPPFSPVTGRRLLAAGDGAEAVAPLLVRGAVELARRVGASSLHVLFPHEAELALLAREGLLLRKDCQFQWRNEGYASFEDFLGQFSSAKRKKVRRERRRVREAGIECRIDTADRLDPREWKRVIGLCATTFLRRGNAPYLNRGFFEEVARHLAAQLLVVRARQHGETVGAAVCFRDDDTLYGRYWGCAEDHHSLHFETCYYQGIDYCIREGLRRFEPGSQGEHKISRGFAPVATWSAHWIAEPQFAAAIGDYLEAERSHVDDYIAAASEHLPFRRDRDAGGEAP